jgi:hypothetical protein
MKTFKLQVDVVTSKTFKSCMHVACLTQKSDLLPGVLRGVVGTRLNSHATLLGSNPKSIDLFFFHEQAHLTLSGIASIGFEYDRSLTL